ncbi:hypothetical protein ESCO_000078 [Escovopsis weberi]|uniref:Uncharacterized protein n=1 Tax=Escovopsis weberi TaxID=150374 RepID=A0A0M8MXI9_ESCWE|nr:hypothetical protein ESCO_000078 [Escovopsis weberi]
MPSPTWCTSSRSASRLPFSPSHVGGVDEDDRFVCSDCSASSVTPSMVMVPLWLVDDPSEPADASECRRRRKIIMVDLSLLPISDTISRSAPAAVSSGV